MIINNINFPCWGANSKRVGSAKDCQLMKKLFGENGLGLTLFGKNGVHEDLKKEVSKVTGRLLSLHFDGFSHPKINLSLLSGRKAASW